MARITINEGLAWLKTLKKRHEELVALRNDNAHRDLVGVFSAHNKCEWELQPSGKRTLVDGSWWMVGGADAR